MIRQLPENVANQIAAGSYSAAASAVKELMENAVDAGASRIDVRVVDAGRTLMHVMDNGVGMVEADAKRCLTATRPPKSRRRTTCSPSYPRIRGEALASIALHCPRRIEDAPRER